MRLMLASIGILCIAVTGAARGEFEQGPALSLEVHGRIVDGKSGAAIARASVALRRKGGPAIVAGAITDEFVVRPDADLPPFLRMPGRLEQHWVVDTTRIRTERGYVEPIARRKALRRTIVSERAHPSAFDPAQFDYAAENRALPE